MNNNVPLIESASLIEAADALLYMLCTLEDDAATAKENKHGFESNCFIKSIPGMMTVLKTIQRDIAQNAVIVNDYIDHLDMEEYKKKKAEGEP